MLPVEFMMIIIVLAIRDSKDVKLLFDLGRVCKTFRSWLSQFLNNKFTNKTLKFIVKLLVSNPRRMITETTNDDVANEIERFKGLIYLRDLQAGLNLPKTKWFTRTFGWSYAQQNKPGCGILANHWNGLACGLEINSYSKRFSLTAWRYKIVYSCGQELTKRVHSKQRKSYITANFISRYTFTHPGIWGFNSITFNTRNKLVRVEVVQSRLSCKCTDVIIHNHFVKMFQFYKYITENGVTKLYHGYVHDFQAKKDKIYTNWGTMLSIFDDNFKTMTTYVKGNFTCPNLGDVNFHKNLGKYTGGQLWRIINWTDTAFVIRSFSHGNEVAQTFIDHPFRKSQDFNCWKLLSRTAREEPLMGFNTIARKCTHCASYAQTL